MKYWRFFIPAFFSLLFSCQKQMNDAGNRPDNTDHVAFKRPDGKKVLIVENDSHSKQSFNILFRGERAVCSLPAGAVATYVW